MFVAKLIAEFIVGVGLIVAIINEDKIAAWEREELPWLYYLINDEEEDEP